MALKIQFNKTALQQLTKQLKMREKALPILKSKEAALRVEVKKAKDRAQELEAQLQERMAEYDEIASLWAEFDKDLVQISNVRFTKKKIAGVDTPVLEDVEFNVKDFSLHNTPSWFPDGVEIIKELIKIAIERDFFSKKMDILGYARKKTTQKVNLYEKVQIPEYEDGIRKIKRFLEDNENLSKSAQKIVKNRQQKKEVAS